MTHIKNLDIILFPVTAFPTVLTFLKLKNCIRITFTITCKICIHHRAVLSKAIRLIKDNKSENIKRTKLSRLPDNERNQKRKIKEKVMTRRNKKNKSQKKKHKTVMSDEPKVHLKVFTSHHTLISSSGIPFHSSASSSTLSSSC